MNSFFRNLLVASSIVLVAACSQEDMMNKLVSKEDAETARSFLVQLNSRNFASLEEQFDPSLKTANLRDSLNKMADMLPDTAPLSEKIIGYQSNSINDVTTKNVTFELEFDDGWIIANVAVKRAADKITIIGMGVNPLKQSVSEMNRFTLADKGAVQYLILLLTVSVVTFIIYALYVCIKTPIARRKWLWMLFVAFGVGTCSLQWNSGELYFSVLSFHLLGAGAVAQLYGPWVISFSFPLGAIVFLAKRKTLSTRDASEQPAGAEQA